MGRLGQVCVVWVALTAWPAAAHAQEGPYEREQPISDPVAPMISREELRGGLEIGFGWGNGAHRADAPVVDLGLGMDGLSGKRLAVGGRLGWLSSGDDFQALELEARARLGLVPWMEADRHQLELQLSAGLRLASAGAHHAVVGLGVSASIRPLRLGVRYERALSTDAGVENLVLGVAEWMTPSVVTYGAYGREGRERLPRIGLGLHLIAGGYALGGLGPALPGLALELPVYFGGSVVAVARWDMLWFQFADGDAVLANSALLGAQWFEIGGGAFGASALVGYSAPFGAVADAGLIWMTGEGWAFGLHARAGIEPDSEDLRAVFVSVGGRQIFR